MKILSLNAVNFLTIGDKSPLLRLDARGLVLIAGDNRDDPSAKSNGAGKSSVPDALCWVLNGVTARGVSGDAVVNSKAKKNCAVTAVLLDGDVVYKIERFRKHQTHKNQAFVYMWPSLADFHSMNPGTPLHKGTERETQEVIHGILGCSTEVFMASIYAGQEKMPDLPGMTDKELKTLIEQAAGVERLERAYTIAKDSLLKASAALGSIDEAINREKTLADSVRADIVKAQKGYEDFEVGKPGRADVYKNEAARIKAEATVYAATVKDLNEPALVARLNVLMPQIDQSKTFEAGKDAHIAKWSSANTAALTAQRHVEQCANKIKQIGQELAQADSKVGTPCRECGKPHTTEDMGKYRAAIVARRHDAELELHNAEIQHGIAKAVADAAKSELDAYIKTIPDFSALMAEVGKIQQGIRESQNAKNKLALLIKDIEKNIEMSKKVLEEKNPFTVALENAKENLTKRENELSALAAQRSVAEANHVLAENVASIFSPSGVRAHVLDTITPFLNERTARYLAAMSDGNISAVWSTLTTTAKGELREKFNIEVENATGGKSFDVLSGGEKRKVRLATMLALQDLVSTRATKPIELWIGDEIDHALDAPGLERLMGILEEKARERGTVLIISHNELGDWVDQVVTVVKEDGESRMEGAVS